MAVGWAAGLVAGDGQMLADMPDELLPGGLIPPQIDDAYWLCLMYSKPDGERTSLKSMGVQLGSSRRPTGQTPSWA